MSELRRDPILDRWVIVSSERAGRPTDFRSSREMRSTGGFCPFCPGNEYTTPPEILSYRPDGSSPDGPGWTLRVVPNKFPALTREGRGERNGDLLFQSMQGTGAHEVIIETPDHDITLAHLGGSALTRVLTAFARRVEDFEKDPGIQYVAGFKNHGASAGATLEHTHSQIIALPVVPNRILAKLNGSASYHRTTGSCIYCDILAGELRRDERIVAADDRWVILCPYASAFPFETWILPRAHHSRYEDSQSDFPSLAAALGRLLRAFEEALDNPDYNLVINTSPLHRGSLDHYHWHMELVPRLSQTAGFEWASAFTINPTPPEEASAHLRKALR